MLRSMDKKHIRQKLRHQRRTLAPDKKTQSAEEIAQSIKKLPEFKKSQHIACYLPHDGEVNPHFIIANAEKAGKQCYIPTLVTNNDHHLEFYSYRLGEPLKKNRFGIGEPDTMAQQHILPNKLDLVLLPLVAFDEMGNRIGRGAGYYDRTFAFLHDSDKKKKPILMGLAYEFQKIPSFQPESWDIPCNIVVTEKQLYR